MKKSFELISLVGGPGCYKATIYNRLGGYYREHSFLWYSKKEVYRLLRNKYDCVVSRKFK